MKLYLLYYDTGYGNKEEWNTFYTPCVVFSSEAARKTRRDLLSMIDEPRFDFHEVELELDDPNVQL